MPYEFDQAAVAYSEARSQCQVATDDALDTAQDLEAVAVEGLINTPSEWPWETEADCAKAGGTWNATTCAKKKRCKPSVALAHIMKRRRLRFGAPHPWPLAR